MSDYNSVDEDLLLEVFNVAINDSILIGKFKTGEIDLQKIASFTSYAVHRSCSLRLYNILFSDEQLDALRYKLEKHESFNENSENI